jgi:hypothetical protein
MLMRLLSDCAHPRNYACANNTTGRGVQPTRGRVEGARRWSARVNLGEAVNTAVVEARPSLTWAGATPYFGRARPRGHERGPPAEQGSDVSDQFLWATERGAVGPLAITSGVQTLG